MRKYRGSSFVLIVERYNNQRGVFMKFSQVRNGEVRNIIVPARRSLWGWKKLTDCLDNLMGRRFWKGGRTSNEIRSGNPLIVKVIPDSKAIKDWKMAITIYCTNTRLSWGEISRNWNPSPRGSQKSVKW